MSFEQGKKGVETWKGSVKESISSVVQKEFSNLWPAWQKEIATAYKDKPLKEVKEFLRKTKQLISAAERKLPPGQTLPQSLKATTLVQYAKGLGKGPLSIPVYEALLQDTIEQHMKLQDFAKSISAGDTEVARDFIAFKRKAKQIPQNVQSIQQGKAFTNDTYIVFQYLASSTFQAKKQTLSVQQRSAFVEYAKSDITIAKVVGESYVSLQRETAPTAPDAKEEVSSITSAEQKTSFERNYDRFSQDFNRPDGPWQIVDQLYDNPQTWLMWPEWIQESDASDIIQSVQKNIPREKLQKIIDGISPILLGKIAKKDLLDYMMGKSWKLSAEQKKQYDRIIVEALEPQIVADTKETVKQKVMKEYFEYVAKILEVWGEVVTMDTQSEHIDYQKDGTIILQYHTPQNIPGSVKISPDGVVTVTDVFEKRGDKDITDNPKVMQTRSRVLNGALPSMQSLLQWYVGNKKACIDTRAVSQWQGQSQEQVMTDRASDFVGNSLETQWPFQNLYDDVTHALYKTQLADAYVGVMDAMQDKTKAMKNGIAVEYFRGNKSLLNRDDPMYAKYTEPLFVLRGALVDMPIKDVHTLVDDLHIMSKAYATEPAARKPFTDENVWEDPTKEPFSVFLAHFCTGEAMFDVRSFDAMSTTIAKDKPTSLDTWRPADNSLMYPRKSLYQTLWPDVAQQFKTEATDVVKNEINDELLELKMGILG